MVCVWEKKILQICTTHFMIIKFRAINNHKHNERECYEIQRFGYVLYF